MFGFGLGSFLGIASAYLLAAAMTAAGIYVAVFFDLAPANPLGWLLRPLRYVGLALAAGGLMLGAYAFGKTAATGDCLAAARLAETQQELAAARRDLAAARAASEASRKAALDFKQRKEDADVQISAGRDHVSKLDAAVARGRRATADDDRRLCAILGDAPAGCGAAR